MRNPETDSHSKTPKSAKICCVHRCYNVYGTTVNNVKVSFFQPNENNLKAWSDAIGKPNLKPTSRICSAHFEESFLVRGKRVLPNVFMPFERIRLHPDAVPSVNINMPFKRTSENKRKKQLKATNKQKNTSASNKEPNGQSLEETTQSSGVASQFDDTILQVATGRSADHDYSLLLTEQNQHQQVVNQTIGQGEVTRLENHVILEPVNNSNNGATVMDPIIVVLETEESGSLSTPDNCQHVVLHCEETSFAQPVVIVPAQGEESNRSEPTEVTVQASKQNENEICAMTQEEYDALVAKLQKISLPSSSWTWSFIVSRREAFCSSICPEEDHLGIKTVQFISPTEAAFFYNGTKLKNPKLCSSFSSMAEISYTIEIFERFKPCKGVALNSIKNPIPPKFKYVVTGATLRSVHCRVACKNSVCSACCKLKFTLTRTKAESRSSILAYNRRKAERQRRKRKLKKLSATLKEALYNVEELLNESAKLSETVVSDE